MLTVPSVPVTAYRDLFSNWCSRLLAPPGRFQISTNAFVLGSRLPEATLVYLLGSRYCETDQLSDIAWQRFGNGPTGWARMQAICDFVHGHIEFGYHHARRTRTAWEVYREGIGVCRDYAHLAIALCRCMNIPARYCTGYLGDYGTPPPYGTMDFAGWFEAFLGDRWYSFDARNNTPRIGRVLIVRGRDACDVALASTVGTNTLEGVKVWTDVVDDSTTHMASP